MDGRHCRGRRGGESTVLLRCFFLFLLVSPWVPADAGTGDGAHHGRPEEAKIQRPDAAERAIGVADTGGAWERLRSWAKIALMNNLRPPDSGLSRSKPSVGKTMEEAAMRSTETSKTTAEEAAEAVATAAGAAVERSKEKVKKVVSSVSGGAAEL